MYECNDLVLLTVHTIQSLIVSTIYVTIVKHFRIELLHNSFMTRIGGANELVI